MWAHSGQELFYRNGANELVAVQVTGDPTFEAGRQVELFSMAGYMTGSGTAMYDLTLDDQRFVMARIEDAGFDVELVVVQNWFEELRQRMGN